MIVLWSWRPGLLFSRCNPESLSLVYKVEVNLIPSFPYSSWWEEKWEKEKTHIPFKGIHHFFLCSHWQELNCKATFNYREARQCPQFYHCEKKRPCHVLHLCLMEPLVNTFNCIFGSSGDCLHVSK